MTDQEKRAKKAAYKQAWAEANRAKTRAATQAYYQRNKEATLAHKAEYRATNKEKTKAQSEKYYAENKEACLAAGKKYRAENAIEVNARAAAKRAQNPNIYKDKYAKMILETTPEERAKARAAYYDMNSDKVAARNKKWSKANPEIVKESVRRRQALKIKRQPKWFDKEKSQGVYRDCPVGYDVDHIIPLQGKLVSGLHWHHNLQILPASINRQKSNKFDPDTYVHELPVTIAA